MVWHGMRYCTARVCKDENWLLGFFFCSLSVRSLAVVIRVFFCICEAPRERVRERKYVRNHKNQSTVREIARAMVQLMKEQKWIGPKCRCCVWWWWWRRRSWPMIILHLSCTHTHTHSSSWYSLSTFYTPHCVCGFLFILRPFWLTYLLLDTMQKTWWMHGALHCMRGGVISMGRDTFY